MKMFHIWITMRSYFPLLSIDIFVVFTSWRYLSLNQIAVHIVQAQGIRFRSEIICSS